MLLGAPCGGFNHKSHNPRIEATVRDYLLELSRAYTVAVRELRFWPSNPVTT